MAKCIVHVYTEGSDTRVSKMFDSGSILTYDHFYLIEEEDVEEVVKKFNEWAEALGPCDTAVSCDPHPASAHVSISPVAISELPDFMRPEKPHGD